MNTSDGLKDLFTPYLRRLNTLDEYPGWTRAQHFLETIVEHAGVRRVADVGGGANPMISSRLVQQMQLDYCLLDISETELQKAPENYTTKLCVDLTAHHEKFLAAVAERRDFDLIFSHMFLEHIAEPRRAHQNMHALLKPGGLAVHFYPSPNNLPLVANRLLPSRVTNLLVRLAQPERDLAGQTGKFKAYYRLCGNDKPVTRQIFASLGYDVLIHSGFVGHEYYRRIPVLRVLERYARGICVDLGIPATGAQLLILQKRGGQK